MHNRPYGGSARAGGQRGRAASRSAGPGRCRPPLPAAPEIRARSFSRVVLGLEFRIKDLGLSAYEFGFRLQGGGA